MCELLAGLIHKRGSSSLPLLYLLKVCSYSTSMVLAFSFSLIRCSKGFKASHNEKLFWGDA